MAISDIFKTKQFKKEIELLKESLSETQNKEYHEVKKMIEELEAKKSGISSEIEHMTKLLNMSLDYASIQKSLDSAKKQSDQLSCEIQDLSNQIKQKKNECIELDEEILLQSFALYKPKYEFENSDLYKNKLESIRDKQKALIKTGSAATGNTNWTVNGNKTEGKKMVNDMIKLVLRSFNNECDSCVSSVKFNNIESCEKRINVSYDALCKLGRIMNVTISQEYKKLKFDELYLAYEYQQKKQAEKEEQKQLREQLREEAKLQKEIEEARKNIEKEQKHYNNAVEKVKKQLESCTTEDERAVLLEKLNELNVKLEEIEKNIKEIDYRAANQKAGYVYIISNFGAFGENVYKIGMTRRLDPQERIDELGDASVPFDFDIHAMIFSNDAPRLENALHKAFENRKLNMINQRREFFNVTLEEIEKVVKANHDKSVEFVHSCDAEEFRQSLLIKQKNP